jgi:hypothetical protein
VSADLSRGVKVYSALTRGLPEFDERSEVENVLIWREAIHEAMLGGQIPSEAEREEIARADDRLVEQASRLAERFPAAFEHGSDVPRVRWWWHLDKGPQVRAEAEQAA